MPKNTCIKLKPEMPCLPLQFDMYTWIFKLVLIYFEVGFVMAISGEVKLS